MRTIYKYQIPLDAQCFKLTLRHGVRILDVQIQNGVPCLWAEIDTDAEEEVFYFFIQGTGNPILEESRYYLGTWQAREFVWHLYSEEDLKR